jgi:hypothetical protein
MNASRACAVLERLLHDCHAGWSVGRVGAIAEFYWDPHEAVTRDSWLIVSPRGALRFNPEHDEARLFAGESLGHNAQGWSQWIALCLPEEHSVLRGRETLFELGPDRDALQTESRQATLFDLGIGGRFFQLCVRTASLDLIAQLRAAANRKLLDDSSLLRSLAASSPDRVFASRLARIEVAQPIASPDGSSPDGPHTHLLPNLLNTPDADAQGAPAGWIPQIIAYPANPLQDERGKKKAFDIEAYREFQRHLDEFGDPGHQQVKRTVMAAVRTAASPQAIEVDAGRRESLRIALRQLHCLDGASEHLRRWRAHFNA